MGFGSTLTCRKEPGIMAAITVTWEGQRRFDGIDSKGGGAKVQDVAELLAAAIDSGA